MKYKYLLLFIVMIIVIAAVPMCIMPNRPDSVARALPLEQALSCETFSSTDGSKIIRDKGGVPTISSLNAAASTLDWMHSLTVTLTIKHTDWDDLKIEFARPLGCWTPLADRAPAANGTYTINFSDSGLHGVSNTTWPGSGETVIPDYLMNVDGKRPSGRWKVKITDNYTGDTGTLLGWSITACNSTGRSTFTPTVTYTPLPTYTPIPTSIERCALNWYDESNHLLGTGISVSDSDIVPPVHQEWVGAGHAHQNGANCGLYTMDYTLSGDSKGCTAGFYPGANVNFYAPYTWADATITDTCTSGGGINWQCATLSGSFSGSYTGLYSSLFADLKVTVANAMPLRTPPACSAYHSPASGSGSMSVNITDCGTCYPITATPTPTPRATKEACDALYPWWTW